MFLAMIFFLLWRDLVVTFSLLLAMVSRFWCGWFGRTIAGVWPLRRCSTWSWFASVDARWRTTVARSGGRWIEKSLSDLLQLSIGPISKWWFLLKIIELKTDSCGSWDLAGVGLDTPRESWTEQSIRDVLNGAWSLQLFLIFLPRASSLSTTTTCHRLLLVAPNYSLYLNSVCIVLDQHNDFLRNSICCCYWSHLKQRGVTKLTFGGWRIYPGSNNAPLTVFGLIN